jgi:hypothetical protein
VGKEVFVSPGSARGATRRGRGPGRAGAEIRGEVLVTLARLRLAMPEQLRGLLLPHQKGTDNVRLALRNLLAERPPLVGRVQRANQSYWFCTPAGLTEAAASGLLPAFNGSAGGRTTGKKAASAKTGLREHGLALVDTVLAFHQADMADAGDWQLEAGHPTPAGQLIPDAVVLLASGTFAFVELDRATMSYARLLAKLDTYAAYRTAPPTGRGNAARAALALAGPLRRAGPGAAVPSAAHGVRTRVAACGAADPRGGVPGPGSRRLSGSHPPPGRRDHHPGAADRARAHRGGVAGGGLSGGVLEAGAVAGGRLRVIRALLFRRDRPRFPCRVPCRDHYRPAKGPLERFRRSNTK